MQKMDRTPFIAVLYQNQKNNAIFFWILKRNTGVVVADALLLDSWNNMEKEA